jgi:hypothetical protein
MSREGPPDEGCSYGISTAAAGTLARHGLKGLIEVARDSLKIRHMLA